MRRLNLVVGSILACLAANAHAQQVQFVPGEVLVKFRADEQRIANLNSDVALAAIGARRINSIPSIRTERISLPGGMSIDDALFYFGGLPTVEYAEPNVREELFFAPNDPRFAAQYAPKKMKCPEAWDLTKGSAGVIVAVLDTGVDKNHEDLKNKLVPGIDLESGDSDPSHGGIHGVHVSGIIAAETNNGKGISGVGFNVRIMPVKVGANVTTSLSAAAIIYAADHGAKVINMSYGSRFESNAERDAVTYAWNKGLILVAAAGNSGSTQLNYPAAFSQVISVGSTGSSDKRSTFSNYGDWVDVGAPGENVVSTVPGGYAEMTGTSMAAPEVAGVVALLCSYAPTASNSQIRAALESTTDPLEQPVFGHGRVNALRALQQFTPGPTNISSPIAVTPWMGVGWSGALSDIIASDGQFAQQGSVRVEGGHVAGEVVDFALSGPTSGLRSSELVLETNGPTAAAGQIYLYNFAAGKFDFIRGFRLALSGKNSQKVILPLDFTSYISSGLIRVGVRAFGPDRGLGRQWKAPFIFRTEFAEIHTRQ
jgi:thermitase